MYPCKKCNSLMIRASYYDPEGLRPLYGGEKQYSEGVLTEWWVCINPNCKDGKLNTSAIMDSKVLEEQGKV